MTRHYKLYSILFVSLLMLVPGGLLAQQLDITGIGLSGSATEADPEVRAGDSVFVIVSAEFDVGTDIEGVLATAGNQDRVLLFFYTTALPNAAALLSQQIVEIASEDIVVETFEDSATVRFGFRMLEALSPQILSMQIQLGVYGLDPSQQPILSDPRTSFTIQSLITPVNDAVDANHAQYLSISNEVDSRPEIHLPQNEDTLGRFSTVEFTLPLDALPGTLTMTFVRRVEDTTVVDSSHILYLSDVDRGEKQIDVDLAVLFNSTGVDSISGPFSLDHDSTYFLKISYVILGGGLSDTAIVTFHADLFTNPGEFIHPDVGTSAAYPDIPLLYRLQEQADSLWITFTADEASPEEDLNSPHILLLSEAAYGVGLHDFILNGNDIGYQHSLIDSSNRGPLDSLRERVIYNVTLSFGDHAGNSTRSITNEGYVWPADNVTLPGSLIAPLESTAENRTFFIEFYLPEEPLPGSVRIEFVSVPPAPPSLHQIFLGNYASAGGLSLILNAIQLDNFSPPVTSITGGTTLIHGTRYVCQVFYRDFHGNPEAVSGVRFTFDDRTEAPVIAAPAPATTLALGEVEVKFTQPEMAIGGTLRITLTQTGGPETDPLSPRVIYLSDLESTGLGELKTITIQPAFLSVGPGIDSVRNAGSLLQRAIYALSVSYTDTLSNTEGSDTIQDLYFPSGSAVYARGRSELVNIAANQSNAPAFMLALQSDGTSALRGVKFEVNGTITPSDVAPASLILWESVDSVFSFETDTAIDTVETWSGGPIAFDSFAVSLSEVEQYYLVTAGFRATADESHEMALSLVSSSDIDCGGDPVNCIGCPIEGEDAALWAPITAFFAETSERFGALRLIWDVSSEYNNAGFNIWRQAEADTSFTQIASYTDTPELYGRGTATSGWRYGYLDENLEPGSEYRYRLQTVPFGGSAPLFVGLEAVGTPSLPPDDFGLRPAYPNPFNPETTIEFVVPEVAEVRIAIFDLLGRHVRELVAAQLSPGIHRSIWNGTDDNGINVPSGVYFYQMNAASVFSETRKMVLIR